MKQFLMTILLCNVLTLCGQDKATIKDYFVHKNELGINATNVLGNVLSLNPSNLSSPYALTYRRNMGKGSLRMGFNFSQNTVSSVEFVDDNRLNKVTTERGIDGRIGFERHYLISPRMLFSVGLDAVYSQFLDDSKVEEGKVIGTGNTKFFQSVEKIDGIGGGPVLRFDFKMNDRISFSTESTLYFISSKSTDELYLTGILTSSKSSTNEKLNLVLPQSLFVNIAF